MHSVSHSYRSIPLYPLFSKAPSNNLPPELCLEIEKYLDKPTLLDALRSLIIPTRAGELISSPALKLHLLLRNVPAEYQHDLANSDDDLWKFALNQLSELSGSQLYQVVKRPMLFKLLQLIDCPVLFRPLKEGIEEKNSGLKKKLFDLVERSRKKEIQAVAARALELLVKAGVDMRGRDLKGIRVPEANLSYAVLDSTQLQKADLRGVKLHAANLHNANLSEAQMAGVQFGELPYLQHDSAVLCCTYSENGKNCAVGLSNGKIYIYETSSWSRVRTLETGQIIKSLAYSPNGEWIVSSNMDQTVRLWSVQNETPPHLLEGDGGSIVCAVYSPNGRQIAAGSLDHTVWLRDTLSEEALHILKGHEGSVVSIAYSRNSERIVSGSLDKTVRVWDALSGSLVHILKGHEGGVFSVACSPDGKQIASCGSDKTVRVWDALTGKLMQIFSGHEHTVCSVAYSPDSDLVASCGADKTVRLWSTRTGKLLQIFSGHQQTVNSVTFSPDGKWLASGSLDKTVRLWEVTEKSRQYEEIMLRRHLASEALNVEGMVIKGVRGLSKMNARLLAQRGAADEPVSLSDVTKSKRARLSQRLINLLKDLWPIR